MKKEVKKSGSGSDSKEDSKEESEEEEDDDKIPKYKVTYSNVYIDGDYKRLNDKNTTTGICTSGSNCWIQATFPRKVKVKEVLIAEYVGNEKSWGPGTWSGAEFQYSKDGKNWIKLFNLSSQDPTSYKCKAKSKYFRVYRSSDVGLSYLIFK